MPTLKLLTLHNPKTIKGEASGYATAILHLAPSTLSGYQVCPMASVGCAAACLNTAGRGGMFKAGTNTNKVQEARIRKTKMFFENREVFMNTLVDDICRFIIDSVQKKMIPTVRLNGTSDIRWENIPVLGKRNIMEVFPNVQFYDYTKLPNRRNLPNNYHLTFSLNEINMDYANEIIKTGMNVAVVFGNGMPNKFMLNGVTYSVLNGDLSDLRFLDSPFSIVALKAKGRAKKDSTGFVNLQRG
jgi:hypothetical protein